jgi:asparagine synthase (glutamine-hydrolysing)
MEEYWELDHNKRIVLKEESEYSKYFLKIFNNAVECRLRSAFPLGSMLSGGLDSSSIVCTAREILLKNGGYPLKTFSFIFGETPIADEQYYINEVIKKGFLDPHFVDADDYSPVSNLDPILWQTDEAIRAFNLYYDKLLSKLASDNGVRILIDGLGGDSTVSHGKGLTMDYILNNHWKNFFEEVRDTSDRLDRNMLKIIVGEMLVSYPGLSKLNFLFKRGNNNGKKILNKEFANEINLNHKIKSLENKLNISEKEKEYHFSIINSGLIQHILEEIDKISAAYNIEPRYPFFDIHLMEFCLAVPSEEKRKYGWDRFLLRQSMNNILPKQIQWRKAKKTGLKSNIHNFINYDYDYIQDILFNNNKNIQNYVDMVIIQETYKNFMAKEEALDFFDLWKVVSLGLWMNRTI